ncbi:(2Fe-2S)-binding protein [Piscirickettsia salmonis]|uniref:Bacterioferritin-associated ferredoxin n=1 Tax=Piscirickettsia salmonis TaxID=1238 RepID=A0A095BLA2_PISSA|nr:(2Fe-2S)-binding protein [Piscirickettsia salmonis]OAJ34636.1 Bacterioferritin-associated ferredoxin [Piscirickettsiaceae bacterium NZ-RLO1]AKP73838.1 (2Fe-2S)-binding protein [Piscirickettsia salmonis LF-89 = ATCC VR-1361]ALA24839.1 BFD-like protein [Piscirickettsia salmonis]ALB22651.1 BFD-like protein [Piscirickettsia salmonis]ALY02662.1 (2Fe-2S)-binding protein [Piscirickettsia salmonis]
MYVCICNRVTDKQIYQAVEDGRVSSMRELCRGYGVAMQCGRCGSCAKEILKGALSQQCNGS